MEISKGGEGQRPVEHLFLMVDVELHRQVQEAANALGVGGAPWVRQMVRLITGEGFPESWQRGADSVPTVSPSGRSARRAHDSRDYDRRFLMRLDEPSRAKLQQLADRFQTPRAEIIRQLIAQASPEAFPRSWQIAAEERRSRKA